MLYDLEMCGGKFGNTDQLMSSMEWFGRDVKGYLGCARRATGNNAFLV